MAENKQGQNIGSGAAGFLAKRMQKSLNRAQEKVLQKLGKNIETRDEQFEQCTQNLLKQQTDGARLLKDVRAYFTAVKAMHESSKRLSQTLKDVYEPDWQGEDGLAVIMDSEDLLWNDYEEKLTDQLVRTMENYTGQFPEVKERVAKRGRKLVDYDSSRHHLEALQSAKKKDDAKINKAEEEFNKAQSVFEEINTELREELPVLYQSRIGCYVTVFQNISNLRDVFYKEMSVLNHELYNVMKQLETQHCAKAFIIKGLNSSKSVKKRKSLIISAPIPCNTAFPADHTSRHCAPDQNGKDPAPADSSPTMSEEPPQSTEPPKSTSPKRPATLPQRQSLSLQPAKSAAVPSETSDSDELSSVGAGSPKRQSVCNDDDDNNENSDVASEGSSRSESVVQGGAVSGQPEDSSATMEEGAGGDGSPQQVAPSPPTESDSQVDQETAPEPEPSQNVETKLPPMPAPRISAPSSRPSPPPVKARQVKKEEEKKKTEEKGDEEGERGSREDLTNTKCTADDPEVQRPPGFLYKAVAVEGLAAEGQLQFKEGDVILVLADTEEKREGMVRGVREESWIEHRDLADHSGFFIEKLVWRVKSE